MNEERMNLPGELRDETELQLEVLEEASWLAFPVYSLLGVDFSLNQWFLTKSNPAHC